MPFFPFAAAATAGALQAWQFTPETYGAKGDGRAVSDMVISTNTIVTSATANFTQTDVGKHIMINGGNGIAGVPVITTIASVQSATSATLTAATGATTTGCQAVWGTDDTAAFKSALAAMKTYALLGSYNAQLVCANKIYVWSAAPVQTTSPANYNTQVQIPYPDLAGATQKLLISMTGAGDSGFAQFFESTIPNVSGTVIVSMQTAPSTPDGTYGIQSVLGGPNAGGAFTGGFANTNFHIDGISIYCPVFTNMKAYHFGFLAGATWGFFSANIFAPPISGTQPRLTDLPSSGTFQGTKGVGCIFPYIGNNDEVAGTRFCVEGYETGLSASDHFACVSLCTVYTDLAMLIDTTQGVSGDSHLVWIGNWSNEAYNGGLNCPGGYCTVDIRMDTETVGGAGDPTYDVQDGGSNLHGIFRIMDADARTNRFPKVTNCQLLEVVNDMMGPGVWAGAPAVPATTVAATNTAYRNATVYVTSGGAAVTVIKVNGTTTGLTLGTSGTVTIRVPQGETAALTYASTAPTWTWMLD
jgi:hypothetical protein